MNKAIRFFSFLTVFALGILTIVGSGGGGGGNGDPAFPVTACETIADDSQSYPGEIINSANYESPKYYAFDGPREGNSGFAILQYMVHDVPLAVTPKNALVVLIAGGQLTAGIEDSGFASYEKTSDGGNVGNAGGNFLVRSAHLFTYRGYRVLTIDRPSDATDFLDPNRPSDTHGSALDKLYRTQVQHAVDLSAMINRANTANDPVIILGTSRGGISAVAQHKLGAAIAISNPVSSGSNGDPVSTTDASQVSSPAHVLWHVNDGCVATQPANSKNLVSAFPDGSGNAVTGGFDAGINPCGAYAYHGFLGIESCAVETTTNWINNELPSLPATKPNAGSISTDTTQINNLDLSGYVTGTSPLSYSLPFSVTSLGGQVAVNNGLITYTAPGGASGKTDTFVYVVTDANGGTSHNVVSVAIP